MMLTKILGDMNKKPNDISTKSTLTLSQKIGEWKIWKIHLETEASGEGIDEETLKRAAEQAKEKCPVSLLLKPGLEVLSLDVRVTPTV